MPTYQYECGACGHSFEILQSMSEAKLRKCPRCKKLKLHRLIGTGAGVIFKGSGFYETDYKRKSPAESSAQPVACQPNCGCHSSAASAQKSKAKSGH